MRFFFPALRKKGEGRGEVTSAGRGVPKDACFSRLQARGNPRSEVSPPKAPSLAIAMFRNTNFLKDFPMFLSINILCQSQNIHPCEVILASPSLCHYLRYRSKAFPFILKLLSSINYQSPGILYWWSFCTPDLQKHPKFRSISLVLKPLEFLHYLCSPEGKNPRKNRFLEK